MFTSAAGDRPLVPNYLVVITDGKSNVPNATWEQAMLARAAGITIISVGIGTGFNQQELEGIASSPISSNVITTQNFQSLTDEMRIRMAEALCNSTYYCPILCLHSTYIFVLVDENNCNPNPCENGAACTDLIGGYECGPCPLGFTGYNCERG
jgi:hypothetical protein